MSRRAPKGAAASILVLFSAISLMMLTVMAYVWGRTTSAKEEVTAHTDAALLTFAEALKRGGPLEYCRDPAVQAILAQYGGPCPPAEQLPGGTGYRIEYQAREMNIEVPTSLFDVQNIEVSTRAATTIPQRVVPSEERRPKFVLVLDYSGSMGSPFPGGGTRTDALKTAVNALLGRGFRIDYGAVIFDNSIVATVPIAQDNERAVAAVVNRYGPMGGTCYHGLATALNMLRSTSNSGYHVLFVTDGLPNGGCSDGRAEAVQLWNNDVKIFTLFVGDGAQPPPILVDLAGAPDRRHNRDYAFIANNRAQLLDVFDRVMGRVPCRAYPDMSYVADPSRVYIGIEGNGRVYQTPRFLSWDAYHNLEEARNPHPFDDNPYCTVNLNPPQGEAPYVLINHKGCEPVLNEGAQVYVRAERPGLAQQ